MATAPEKKFKIGDVCKQADVQPYVLRYWETEFPPLAPDKSGGGQRTYTQRDIEVVMRIKELLYTEGFTIAGAKKKLEAELRDEADGKSPALQSNAAPATTAAANPKTSSVIKEVRKELRELLTMLK
jgi:DNA-binding transcriptional MerR regulator